MLVLIFFALRCASVKTNEACGCIRLGGNVMEFEIGIGIASDLQSEGASGGGAPVDFGACLSGGACDSHEDAGERGTDGLEADCHTLATMH